VNGKTVQCTSQISPDCQDDKQSGQIFFPVLGNPGEQYDVSLVATSDSGESVTLDRNFSIVKPAVSIQPITQVGDTGATVWRKVNGYYQNLDGTEATDSSDTELETTTGATVTLEPLFNVADLQGALQMHWLVDGQPVTDPDLTTGQISFTADKLAGENYSVSIQGLYTQPTEIRKALYDIWGVSPTISTETTLEHTVQIAVFQNDNDTASITTHPFKYFGSLLAYIPASVLFAVRLAFSIALALFSLGFVLSFVPETGSRGRR
jgi:hypothetical protein